MGSYFPYTIDLTLSDSEDEDGNHSLDVTARFSSAGSTKNTFKLNQPMPDKVTSGKNGHGAFLPDSVVSASTLAATSTLVSAKHAKSPAYHGNPEVCYK